jgi:hypothetical protein
MYPNPKCLHLVIWQACLEVTRPTWIWTDVHACVQYRAAAIMLANKVYFLSLCGADCEGRKYYFSDLDAKIEKASGKRHGQRKAAWAAARLTFCLCFCRARVPSFKIMTQWCLTRRSRWPLEWLDPQKRWNEGRKGFSLSLSHSLYPLGTLNKCVQSKRAFLACVLSRNKAKTYNILSSCCSGRPSGVTGTCSTKVLRTFERPPSSIAQGRRMSY